MNRQRIVYVSVARPELDDVDVAKITAAAQARNRELGVNGALAFGGRCFAQVLEGPQAVLERLMSSIMADPRHHRFALLRWDENPSSMWFDDWLMAYVPAEGIADLLRSLADDPRLPADGVDTLMNYLVKSAADASQANFSGARNT